MALSNSEDFEKTFAFARYVDNLTVSVMIGTIGLDKSSLEHPANSNISNSLIFISRCRTSYHVTSYKRFSKPTLWLTIILS